jgi:exodeoxyribonuclease VII large subunit
MAALLHRLEQRLDDFSFRLEAAVSEQLRERRGLVTELAAAVLRHDPRRNLGLARERLAACRTRLDRTVERRLDASAARLNALNARLQSLSPLAVLDRGYALVLDAGGGLVRSVAQVAKDDKVVTRLADGVFTSRVESTAKSGKPLP